MAGKAKEQDSDLTIEEEELGDGPVSAAPATAKPPSSMWTGGPAPMALFAIGALLLLGSLVLLGIAFTNDYYHVEFRQGPQPDGDTDNTNLVTAEIGLQEYVVRIYAQGTGDPDRQTFGWDQSPIVGIAMMQLAWTSYVGLGLLALAFLAAVLHRFGALTVAGPAPMMALFGIVAIIVGLTVFATDIAHHARIQWFGGSRLDLAPAFWTSNADGDFVHDVYMNPLAGFWFHAAGTAAAAVGSVLLFWGQITDAGRAVQRFVESAPVE